MPSFEGEVAIVTGAGGGLGRCYALALARRDAAPSGVILQAAGGRFSVAAIMESPWIDLGPDASPEAVQQQWHRISDLSAASGRG